jgi:hypothetical protein
MDNIGCAPSSLSYPLNWSNIGGNSPGKENCDIFAKELSSAILSDIGLFEK